MITRETWTETFWNAAYFLRRAPHRNRLLALRVLDQVVRYSTGTVRDRAADLMREVHVRKSASSEK